MAKKQTLIKQRKKRREKIAETAQEHGVTETARRYKISRQRVYQILRQEES